MAKRASLKGMGDAIFNIGRKEEVEVRAPSDNQESIPSQNEQGRWPKATFYLPIDLQQRLAKRWFQLKEKNRRLTKSDIVRQALEQYLRQEN